MCQNIYLKTRGHHLLIKLHALLKACYLPFKTLRHHHVIKIYERENDDDDIIWRVKMREITIACNLFIISN